MHHLPTPHTYRAHHATTGTLGAGILGILAAIEGVLPFLIGFSLAVIGQLAVIIGGGLVVAGFTIARTIEDPATRRAWAAVGILALILIIDALRILWTSLPGYWQLLGTFVLVAAVVFAALYITPHPRQP